MIRNFDNFVNFPHALCKRCIHEEEETVEREKIDCLWRISDDQIKGRSQTGNLFDYHPSLLKQYSIHLDKSLFSLLDSRLRIRAPRAHSIRAIIKTGPIENKFR